MSYKWTLLTRPGTSHKRTCPNCGRARSFRPYADDSGMPFSQRFDAATTSAEVIEDAEKVGMCDHRNQCGWNYTPAQFYAAHKSRNWTPSTSHKSEVENHLIVAEPVKFDLVRQSRSEQSTLVQYWRNVVRLPSAELTKTLSDYWVGATRSGRVIYWMIDSRGNAKDGKFIAYKSDGHRYKEDDCKDGATYELRNLHKVQWAVFTMMRTALSKQGLTPDEIRQAMSMYEVQRPYYGEHLLADPKQREKPVGLVEGEKSCLICSTLMPQYIWLAIGTSSPNEGRMTTAIYQKREIHLFPDLDQLEQIRHKQKQWTSLFKELVTIEDDFIRKWSMASNDDIGDILLRLFQEGRLQEALSELLRPKQSLNVQDNVQEPRTSLGQTETPGISQTEEPVEQSHIQHLRRQVEEVQLIERMWGVKKHRPLRKAYQLFDLAMTGEIITDPNYQGF